MRRLILAAVLSLFAAPALAQTPAATTSPPPPSYGAPIGLEAAQALIARGIEAARASGWRLAFAVVEPSGEPVAFARMDDTQYGSNHVAVRKAATAARYRIATSVMEERTQAGRVVTLANEDALPIAGGVPIVVDGRIVGALGVSGGTSAQDDQVARAALQTP